MYSGNDIRVIGAGVAGAIFAYLASRKGINVSIYDVIPYYIKPCGEAIPSWIVGFLEDAGIPLPRIVEEIKLFSIYNSEGKLVRRAEFDKALWYIIDKADWINNIRNIVGVKLVNHKFVQEACNGTGLVFDARGPFSSNGLKIVVWQADVENTVGIYKESIQIIDFNTGPGLVWIFSKKDRLNIGGGFYNESNPRARSIKLINKLINIENIEKYILKEKHSILTLVPEIKIIDRNCIRLGESAGLVMSLGGEGIRPALLSAFYAYKALEKNGDTVSFDTARYYQYLGPLIYQVKLNRLIFRLGAALGQVFIEKVLKGIDENVLEEWFSGNLGLRTRLIDLLYRVMKTVLT